MENSEIPKKRYADPDVGKAIDSLHNGPAGGRMLNAYMKEFDIKPADLEGKRVLDLGTSVSLAVARELQMRAIKADVVSFSPIFADPYLRAQAKIIGNMEKVKGAVAGMGENLPFADASFDYILSLHMFEYLKTDEREDAFLHEVARVLAQNGTAYIGPLFIGQEFDTTKDLHIKEKMGTAVRVEWQEPEWRKTDKHAWVMRITKPEQT